MAAAAAVARDCCTRTWSGPFFTDCADCASAWARRWRALATAFCCRERLGLGLGDGGLRGRGCGHGSVVLLLGDHVLLDQRGVAINVRLRLERVGLGLGDARVGGLHLLLRLRNHIGCPLHIAGGGADHGADRDLRDGHIDRGLGVLGLRAGQVGLRLIERDLVIGGVDLGQQLARLHGLVVVHGDLHHLARNARADLVEVAVHLRVVGVFDECGAPEEEGRAENDQQHDADDGELAVAVGHGGVVGLALGDGADLGCGLVGGLRAAPVLFVCHGYFPPRKSFRLDCATPRARASESLAALCW